VLAADIANELAQQLILNSPTNLTAAQQSQLDLATAEIEKLSVQLQDTRAQLQLLDAQIAAAQTDNERDLLLARRDPLLEQVNQASSNLAGFSATVAALQQRTNSLDIVERARVPSAPGGLSAWIITLVGAVLGIGLAWVAMLVIEYLDDTVRTPDQVTKAIGLPVLGAIARFGNKQDGYPQRLITALDSTSPFAEGYRALRTNLLFSTEPGAKQAYIITSVGPQEGKSVTAANLAVVMAMAGLRVLLVDADLRRPKVHHIFELPNRVGLTTLLAANPLEGDGPLDAALPNGDQGADCLQSTRVSGLRVITSGFLPSNPTEVLGSALMRRWFKAFVSANNVDVVIFDVSPSLVVSDSMALAAATGAEVLIVVEAGRARRRDVLQAREQFAKINVEVKGVILNQINARESGYGYGYYYYSSDTAPHPNGKQQKLPETQKPSAPR
jgi:succinoglycan biosynthesis transport protein ExoP